MRGLWEAGAGINFVGAISIATMRLAKANGTWEVLRDSAAIWIDAPIVLRRHVRGAANFMRAVEAARRRAIPASFRSDAKRKS